MYCFSKISCRNLFFFLSNRILTVKLVTELCICVVLFDDRRGCSFSHEMNSDHNEGILREHELESLSRTELCTLLLQSDNMLLPPVSLTTYIRCIQRSYLNQIVWLVKEWIRTSCVSVWMGTLILLYMIAGDPRDFRVSVLVLEYTLEAPVYLLYILSLLPEVCPYQHSGLAG